MSTETSAATDGTAPAATGGVVVGVDDSAHSRAALAWAVEHARRIGGRVHAYAIWAPASQVVSGVEIGAGMLVPDGVADEQLEIDAGRRIDAAVADLPAGAADLVERHVLLGDAATVLVEASHGAELLVVGNARRGALAGAVAGSVALRCVHHARCPVVLVPDPEVHPEQAG